MGGFNNPIVAAGGSLVYPAIKSPNYVPGVSGWAIFKNGTAQFASIIIPPGSGGARVFIQATPPAGANTGDLWFDTSNGNRLNQWTGSAWTAYQYGTNSIASGAITAALIAANTITAGQIAANTITAGQIAAGTITATQIAANTITAAKIAANTITAGQLAANTITAGQLAAGIIYAGIVNGTTITGAQIVADGSNGQILVYSGTPATGNLIASISGASGTDGFTNPYLAGITSQDNASAVVLNLLNGLLSIGTQAQINASRAAFVASAAPAGGILTLDSGKQTALDTDCEIQIKSTAVSGTGFPQAEILGSLLVDNFISVNSAGGQQLLLTSTSTPGTPISQIAAPGAGNVAFGISVSGDTNDRYQVDSAGKTSWGNGSSGVDTNLYRISANNLQTDDNFIAAGTLTADGIASHNAGTNTAGSGTVRTPGFASGTASQLTDTTTDYMVYFQIGTAGTGFSLKIGPGNPPGNTIYTSATPPAGLFLSFRLPAGWFVQWGGTGTTLASQKAIRC